MQGAHSPSAGAHLWKCQGKFGKEKMDKCSELEGKENYSSAGAAELLSVLHPCISQGFHGTQEPEQVHAAVGQQRNSITGCTTEAQPNFHGSVLARAHVWELWSQSICLGS